MAHTHTDDCERLHGILESLKARQPAPTTTTAQFEGVPVPALTPDHSELTEPLTSDQVNVDREIETVRRALEVLGCDRD